MESKEDEKGQWHPVIYFGKTNLNGRVYEKESLSEEAVEKMRDAMDNKQFLGELGHPHPPRALRVGSGNAAVVGPFGQRGEGVDHGGSPTGCE